jgi:hypothetical protein
MTERFDDPMVQCPLFLSLLAYKELGIVTLGLLC